MNIVVQNGGKRRKPKPGGAATTVQGTYTTLCSIAISNMFQNLFVGLRWALQIGWTGVVFFFGALVLFFGTSAKTTHFYAPLLRVCTETNVLGGVNLVHPYL